MTYALLEEDIETYILFAVLPVYFVILSVIQSFHLKGLKRIENKYTKTEAKTAAHQHIRKLKMTTPFYLLIGATIHTIVYFIFAGEVFRYGYLISIGIFYLIFALIMYINFWLKGSSILKGTGDFGGLPG